MVVLRARDRRGGAAKAPWAREASLLMFAGESNQHPEHLLATSDRSFKCTSNGRASTDASEMMENRMSSANWRGVRSTHASSWQACDATLTCRGPTNSTLHATTSISPTWSTRIAIHGSYTADTARTGSRSSPKSAVGSMFRCTVATLLIVPGRVSAYRGAANPTTLLLTSTQR